MSKIFVDNVLTIYNIVNFRGKSVHAPEVHACFGASAANVFFMFTTAPIGRMKQL